MKNDFIVESESKPFKTEFKIWKMRSQPLFVVKHPAKKGHLPDEDIVSCSIYHVLTPIKRFTPPLTVTPLHQGSLTRLTEQHNLSLMLYLLISYYFFS